MMLGRNIEQLAQSTIPVLPRPSSLDTEAEPDISAGTKFTMLAIIVQNDSLMW
jgi:hypothetical protein